MTAATSCDTSTALALAMGLFGVLYALLFKPWRMKRLAYWHIPEPYRRSIQEADIRPEWASLHYHNRYLYPGRVNAARNRIARVHARLHLVDRTPDEPDFPTELRLLREALDLLDPDVKLA